MSPLSASPTGTARAAVLGSTTSCGTRLRQMLAEFGVPGSRVDLYAAVDSAEPILSEYKGEARLVQKPDLDELFYDYCCRAAHVHPDQRWKKNDIQGRAVRGSD